MELMSESAHVAKWSRLEQVAWVSLYFLSLPNVETAIARVAERVRQGGHNRRSIRRRFDAGLRNFHLSYKQAVNDWALFDNTGEEPVMLEWGENT